MEGGRKEWPFWKGPMEERLPDGREAGPGIAEVASRWKLSAGLLSEGWTGSHSFDDSDDPRVALYAQALARTCTCFPPSNFLKEGEKLWGFRGYQQGHGGKVLTSKENQKRRDEVLKRMLKMKPKPFSPPAKCRKDGAASSPKKILKKRH